MSARPIGIVTGTALGRALAARLSEDGVSVVAGSVGEAQAICSEARLLVVDAEAPDLVDVATALGPHLDGNHLLAHTVRGLSNGQSAMAILHRETAVRRLGVIAGPLAIAELEAGRPTAAVVASRHPEVVEEFAETLSTPRLRVYRGRDPIGVELASGVAELVAVGCGVIQALSLGPTTRAILLVRAVRELGRLTVALGGDSSTASGLAGLGDLLVRASDEACAFTRFGSDLANAFSRSVPEPIRVLSTSARNLRVLAAHHNVAAHVLVGLSRLLDQEISATDLLRELMALPVLDD